MSIKDDSIPSCINSRMWEYQYIQGAMHVHQSTPLLELAVRTPLFEKMCEVNHLSPIRPLDTPTISARIRIRGLANISLLHIISFLLVPNDESYKRPTIAIPPLMREKNQTSCEGETAVVARMNIIFAASVICHFTATLYLHCPTYNVCNSLPLYIPSTSRIGIVVRSSVRFRLFRLVSHAWFLSRCIWKLS